MPIADNLARFARYTPGGDDPADPAQVLAMPLVLHIPKTDPPTREGLLEAAARATVLACLDPRAEPGGEWADAFDAWCAGRIRKIARRARGAQWAVLEKLPGVTVDVGGASARAFVPGPVGRTDPLLRRLQIEGTDVAGPLPPEPPAPGDGGLCLWVAPDLPMTVGKLAAQVSHASMLGAELVAGDTQTWYDAGCPLVVRQAEAARWKRLLADAAAGEAAAVRDAGYTEVAPGSCTVIAQPVSAR